MSANVVFSLCAAAGAAAVSTASAVKGRWEVAIVFGLLVVGFIVRALEGRREAARDGGREAPRPAEPELPPRAPAPAPRRIKPARFKRR